MVALATGLDAGLMALTWRAPGGCDWLLALHNGHHQMRQGMPRQVQGRHRAPHDQARAVAISSSLVVHLGERLCCLPACWRLRL